jgi:hypothetical protein
MTNFDEAVLDRARAVSCMRAVHHLPTAPELDRCLPEIGRPHARSGIAVRPLDLTASAPWPVDQAYWFPRQSVRTTVCGSSPKSATGSGCTSTG